MFPQAIAQEKCGSPKGIVRRISVLTIQEGEEAIGPTWLNIFPEIVVPLEVLGISQSRAVGDYIKSALKPACLKWWSPVRASVTFSSRITTNEVQSVNVQPLS